MQTSKFLLYPSLLLLLLTACSETPAKVQKTETVLEHKTEVVKEAKKSVAAANTAIEKATVQANHQAESLSGSTLYTNKCASCHGSNAKKSALNASVAIAGWDSQKTQDALNGYKTGEYGGKMKAIMQGQSKPLSDEEIKLIAEYIAVL
jgi:cytochrome c553